MPNTLEVVKMVDNWCIKRNIYTRTTHDQDQAHTNKIGILNDGTFLAIEVKAEGKRKNVTANQKLFLDTINERGGIAVVVSCQEDLDELDVIIAARKHVVMYDN